ncbi:MAG: cytochrome biosis protein [Nitrospirae bacterium]|nr:cytochrome biosis protein [Nitrospirota bacterium]MBS1243303.1 cytochrome biosis protein [Nitrospirota bacterium]
MTDTTGKKLAVRCAALFALLFCLVTTANGAERVMLKIGDPPPPFSLQDTEGRTVTAPGDFRGKTVVVHFWADWCPYCLEEMPVLDTLYRQYGKQGLVVYAVNVGQGLAAARAYINRVNITYPVLLDPEGKTAKLYGVLGLPRTFFIDRKGNIKYKLLGEASGDTLRKLVLNTL